MEVTRLVDHQIRVEAKVQEGAVTLQLADGQTVNWPVNDPTVASGQMYLTLSVTPQLPDKATLARQVLQEILQGSQ